MADRTYTLVRLPSHCCKWPVSENPRVVGRFLFCGRAQKPGSVYCTEHYETAYPARSPSARQPQRPVAAE